MFKYPAKKYLLPLISGVLLALPFYSHSLSPIAWFSLVPLFIALDGIPPRESFKLGVVFGIGANYTGQYWLVGTLTRFGGFPLIASIVFIFILCVYLALQFSIFTYICSKFRLLKNSSVVSTLLMCFVWVVLEHYYPHLFPYGVGNSQGFNTTMIQVVDLFGVHFLSFMILLVNIALFRVYKMLKNKSDFPFFEVSVSIILLLFTAIYGHYRIGVEDGRIERAPKIRAGIVQANFDFFEKTEDNEDTVTEKHKRMSYDIKDSDLIIWPETAVQSWFALGDKYYTSDNKPVVPDIENTLFLIGGLSFEDNVAEKNPSPEPGLTKYNSAFLLESSGKVLGRYHKIELLIFGEYLPFAGTFPFIKELSPATGDFTPGSQLELLESREHGLRIAPLICYEDIIPWFSREFINKGANLLVNLTNDAWFGRSIAPYQHLLISIPRAVETRRFFIRSTNTGVSAFIDSAGRVYYKSKIFQDVAISKEVALMDGVETFYVKFGGLFPVFCAILSVLLIYYTHLRRKYIR